jgi:hypothetical protein
VKKKKTLTIKQKEILANCQGKLINDVYQACRTFEILEGAGIIKGSGHRLAQMISSMCDKLIDERLEKKQYGIVDFLTNLKGQDFYEKK